MKLLAQINGQDRRRGLVGQRFKELGGIGYPEGGCESGTDFTQTLHQAQEVLLQGGTGVRVGRRWPLGLQAKCKQAWKAAQQSTLAET